MKQHNYILVVGCTGVGKSTIANHIAKYFEIDYLEDPYINNPFLSDAYGDVNKSFQSQIFFFKEFLKIHKYIASSDISLVQDRSIYESVYIFCKHFFLQKKFSLDEYNLCVDLLNEVCSYLKLPNIMVHITADTNVILDRINKRNRPFEKDIDSNYISVQKNLYLDWLTNMQKEKHVPILSIDNSNLTINDCNAMIVDKIRDFGVSPCL